MSIQSELATLVQNKADIKAAIEAKKSSTISNDMSTWSREIELIPYGYYIRVAEFDGVTVSVTDSNNINIGSKLSTGGILEFPLSSSGTYTVSAFLSGSNIWSRSVNVSDYGTYLVKGRTLLNMTAAQIHEACQLGIASKMFSIGDIWTFTQTGSIMNNKKFFIAHFFKVDNKDQIQFMLSSGSSYTTTYNMNSAFYYSSNGTSFTNTFSNLGGYKYSTMRQRFLPKGSTVYSHAQSLKSNTATITTGIAWNDFHYTTIYTGTNGSITIDSDIYNYSYDSDNEILVFNNQNYSELSGELTINSKTYSYNYDSVNDKFSLNQLVDILNYTQSTDSFTKRTSWTAPTQAAPLFVKGYWKSVGAINESVFNLGYYYTFASNVYTHATTWTSGKTYYGFFEFLQDNGIFYSAFSSLIDNNYLVDLNMKGFCGNGSNVQQYTDKITIISVGELLGLNKTGGTYIDGTSSGTLNFGDAPGVTKFDGIIYNKIFGNTNTWIRSVVSNGNQYFCFMSSSGDLGFNNSSASCRIRPSFRFQ